ncbi:MAG: type IV pilus twitching motility protein PilT [Deltaproteobacteria bacterium]|nr:type IV pilus twitching motility protein PilT [Deltaproteobacteria bacterium]
MSPQFDKFILALFKKSADQLIFTSGQPVKLNVGGQEKVILDTPVRNEQIDKLVLPTLKGGDAQKYQTAPESEFLYDSPNGKVTIKTRRAGERLMVVVTPATGGSGADEDDIESVMRAASSSAAAPPPPPPPPPPSIAKKTGASAFATGFGAGPGKSAQIDKILTQIVQAGASDLHMTAQHRPKMRKDGDIMDVPGWDVLSGEQIETWMTEVAHERARKDYEETNDSDYAHEVQGIARFRMNLFRDRHGTSAVIRQIPSKIQTMDDLGIPKVVRRFCELPKGLVTVTGPTGSGKSTTLAAMVDHINKTRSDHIITIEDPVEFVHKSQKCLVNQREVHTHTQSFSRALRAALREDPDIVLVGEMRDLETVSIAIETAETGHLVFGTLHTNTAPSTVDRIIDQFPTDRQQQIRIMLSETLRGVVAQTLAKRLGGGRVAILEILICNSAVSNLIREGKTFQIQSSMQMGRKSGMQTQIDAMVDLIRAGVISPFEAYSKAVDQVTMKKTIESNSWNPDLTTAVSG